MQHNMETEDKIFKNYGTISEAKVEEIGEESCIDDINVVEIDNIGLCTAIKEVTLKAIPSVLMLFVVNGVIFFSNFFIGLKGDSIDLTGCGLGAVTINMVILSLDFGICDGMDALVSRAYGRRDFQSCEIYLNQCRYMILMLAIPQFLIMLFLENIYDALGQPPKIAHSAWIFCIITFPGCILMNLFECNRRYLVCCEVYNAGTIINGITFALHIILLYITVIQFDLGIYGTGISTTFIFTLDFILFEIYRRFQVDEVHLSRWRLPSKLMLSHSYEFLQFAIPCSLALILSWWPIEIITIFAGMMGAAQLTASTMLSNIYLLCCDIALGVGYASVAVVGNSLGENLPHNAITYKNASFLICTGLSTLLVVFLVSSKELLIGIYTETDEEADQVRHVYIFFLFDIVFGVFYENTQEILEVLGHQYLLLCAVVIFSWFVMIPACYIVGITLAFGYLGLRVAFSLPNIFLTLTNFWLIWKANWSDIAIEASSKE